MGKKQGSIGAWDLMQQLQNDPEWMARTAELEAQKKVVTDRIEAGIRPEQEPMLVELAGIGMNVSSVWDLVNSNDPYPAAIPILVRYLPRARHPIFLDGLARALTLPEVRGLVGPDLLVALRREADPETRWVLANALTVTAGPSELEGIEALLKDASYTNAHERLKVAARTAKRPLR